MKRYCVRFLALFLALLMVLSGCTATPAENSIGKETDATDTKDEKVETTERTEPIERDTILRVVTVNPDNWIFNNLHNHIRKWEIIYEYKHKDVDVVIENMAGMERQQAELMAGKGPDVILSPTASTCYMLIDRWEGETIPIPDVNLAMRNGIFYDISEFYDADTELNKEALVPAVMEAGVLDGKRYVLPLRYNLLTAYVDLDRFAKTGLSTEIFEKNITYFWDALTEYGNGPLASSALIRAARNELILLGDLIDYDNQEVLLTQDALVKYLQSKQNFLITRGVNEVSFYALLNEYCSGLDTGFVNSGWMNVMNPKAMFVSSLDFAIHNAVIAEAEGINLGMYPLRTIDGSVTADITFYGAVTGGSQNPELAYEFLRYFLTEGSQWETDVTLYDTTDKLLMPGWPVLAKGSAGAEYEKLKNYTYPVALHSGKFETIQDIEPYTDEDIPFLSVTVDKARFPTGLEEEYYALSQSVYNVFTGARIYDLESATAEFIEQLEWHVGEG